MRRTENQKLFRGRNKTQGEDALGALVSWDYEVVQFSEYHFRINGKVDVWPVSRKWYEPRTGRKGVYSIGGLEKFIKQKLPR